MAVTRLRGYGDSLMEGRGRGNPLNTDPKRAMPYTIGYGLGLADSQIVNNGVAGSGIGDALTRQKQTPAGGPGSLDMLWTGHNTIRPTPTPALVQSVKDGYLSFYTYARSNGGSCLLLGMVTGFGITKDSDLYAAVADINAYIAATFPARDRFLSYEYVARQIGPDSSATCQALIDAGLTPTAIDRSDIVSGWTPDSIRADAGIGHLNQVGYDTYGNRLVRHINAGGGGGGQPVTYVGSLTAAPSSPAVGVSVVFTASVTPAPATYKFRWSDGTVRAYTTSNTASKTMPSGPLTAILDVKDGAGVETLNVATRTVRSPTSSGLVAKSSRTLHQSYGINTHFSYLGDSEWANTADALRWVSTLGVGAVRQLLPTSNYSKGAVKTAILALDAGVKWLCPMFDTSLSSLAAFRAHVNSQLNWLEANIPLSRLKQFSGPNEPNEVGLASSEWVQPTRWAQQALYEEVRARPAFNHVSIGGPPLNMKGGVNEVPQDVDALGNLSQWLDRGDVHVYPADDDPEFNLTVKLGWLEPIHPGKPVTVSEGGYTTALNRGYTGGSKLTAEGPAAMYAVKHILTHAVGGREFYSYETLDGAPPYANTERAVRESGFGLVRVPSNTDPTRWTAKPSFDATRRLLGLFKDTPHTPTSLNVTISGPADLRSALFQKASGVWLLALWRVVDLWNWDSATQTGTAPTVTQTSVQVTFGQARPVSIYEPNTGDAAVSTYASTGSFSTLIGSKAQIIQISGGADKLVGGFTGTLTANPTSPAVGVSVVFTATVTPTPALYKFRYSDGTIRNYAAGNTASKVMPDAPLTVILDVQDSSGVNTLDVATLTVRSSTTPPPPPPPPGETTSGFLPFFAAS